MNCVIKYSVIFAMIAIIYFAFFNDKNSARLLKTFAAPRWNNVVETFRKQVESGLQRGGALSVYHNGELVVEAYGGFADDDIYQEWTNETVTQLFSATKAFGGLVMAMLVERGLLDYSKLVSHYWAEFAQNGKEDITVEQLLSHQAGLAALDEPFDFFDILNDDKKMSTILASQKPFWKPGKESGYHSFTIGLYQDQLVKRIDPEGRTLAQFFNEEISKPFGIDLFIGLPKEENYRCARAVRSNILSISDLVRYAVFKVQIRLLDLIPDSVWYKMVYNPPHWIDSEGHHNQPSWRSVPVASTNGFGTASALAKLYGILANGGFSAKNNFLLNGTLIKLLYEPLVNGTDIILSRQWVMGRGVTIWKSPMDTIQFGHQGAGGQMGVSDPANKLGIGYVTNHLTVDSYMDDKYVELEKVIYETIEKL